MVVANECVFRQTSCVFIDLNPCGVYACINRFFFSLYILLDVCGGDFQLICIISFV